jgi:hypothetical protein
MIMYFGFPQTHCVVGINGGAAPAIQRRDRVCDRATSTAAKPDPAV